MLCTEILKLKDMLNKNPCCKEYSLSSYKILSLVKMKKGPRTWTSNYRPIAFIPTVSKLKEQIFLERLLTHLEQKNLLTSQQHEFLTGRFTVTNIFFHFITRLFLLYVWNIHLTKWRVHFSFFCDNSSGGATIGANRLKPLGS